MILHISQRSSHQTLRITILEFTNRHLDFSPFTHSGDIRFDPQQGVDKGYNQNTVSPTDHDTGWRSGRWQEAGGHAIRWPRLLSKYATEVRNRGRGAPLCRRYHKTGGQEADFGAGYQSFLFSDSVNPGVPSWKFMSTYALRQSTSITVNDTAENACYCQRVLLTIWKMF